MPHAERAALITAASTLAMLVGAILLLARLLRLGFVANFISDPVLTGFKAGVGLVIVLDQAPKLLGVHYDKVGWVHDAAALIRHVPETSMPTLAVGIATLGIILGLEHFAPRLPSPLFVVGGGIAASFFLALQSSGVAVVGHIPGGLPPLVRPDPSLLVALWPGAMAIALMSFTETIAAGRAFVAPGEPRPNPNQELVATGAANVLGGLFAAMPGGGGTSQTAVNRKAGARASRERRDLDGGPRHAALPGADHGPHTPGDAGGRRHRILDRPRQPRGVPQDPAIPDPGVPVGPRGVRGGGAAGTLKGILAAVLLSMLSLLHMANNPPVYTMGRKRGTDVFRPLSEEHPDDETFPGLLILRTEGRLYSGTRRTSATGSGRCFARRGSKVVLLDCSGIPSFEFTALKMIVEAEAKLRAEGVALWLAALSPEALPLVQASPLGAGLGRGANVAYAGAGRRAVHRAGPEYLDGSSALGATGRL